MKKFLLILLVLLIVGVGGYFGWRYVKKNSINIPIVNPQSYMWGVTVNQAALGKYNPSDWNHELDYVNQLGASWIRVNFDFDATGRNNVYNSMVNQATEQGLNTYVALESSSPIEEMEDPGGDGTKVANAAADLFNGRVKYYQILNEQGGMTIKGGEYGGEGETDFDQEKYQKVKDWTEAAIDVIRTKDKNAKIVITCHWTHVGYVEMLLRDQIDFDILGWDWYSDMGPMQNKTLADGTLLVDKLKSFKKTLILAEVNALPEDAAKDDDSQAEFIQDQATWAYQSGYIKGFFVHELTDTAPWPGRKANYFGLISLEKTGRGEYDYDFDGPKKAFYTYQAIISKHQ